MRIRTAGAQFMRDNPERFIESNTENSWLRFLNNMSIQGTWADALIIQAVADASKVTIQIVESNQGFAPLTTVYPQAVKPDIKRRTLKNTCLSQTSNLIQSNRTFKRDK